MYSLTRYRFPQSHMQNIGQVEVDLNVQKKELDIVKREIEKASGPGADNFIRKMKLFLRDAGKQKDDAVNEMDSLWEMLGTQMEGWGEKKPKRGASPDPAQEFFGCFAKFCTAYHRAVADNKRRKELAEKKARQEAERAARSAKRKQNKGATATGDDDDIFGKINAKLKQGNAQSIIDNFKANQAKRAKNKPAGGRRAMPGMGAMDMSELKGALGRRRGGSRR